MNRLGSKAMYPRNAAVPKTGKLLWKSVPEPSGNLLGYDFVVSDKSSETASNIKIGLLGMCRRSHNHNERRRNILFFLRRVGFATVLCSHNHTSVSYSPHIEQVSDSTVSVRIY